MTPEQQRIAIAEWMFPDYPTYTETGCLRHHYPDGRSGPAHNYPQDLNAMHEVEKFFALKDLARFLRYTEVLCCELSLIDYGYYPGDTTPNLEDISKLIILSASQRSEALCRTLWPEIAGELFEI